MGASKSLQGVFLNDDAGNPVAVVLDGSVYRLQMQGKILNAAGAVISPATEATLAAADTKLGTIDGVLDAIKDTDGIKKITDPLPAGTNNIGDVDVVSSALPTGAATAANQATVIGHVDGLEALLASLDGKDYATQTTLATLATETKLEAVRVLLASLDGKDYSTQTTLAALLAAFNAEDFASQTTLATLATQATLAAADAKLATIDAVLDSIKDTDGVKKITDALPVGDNVLGKSKIVDDADAVVGPVQVVDAVNRMPVDVRGSVSIGAPIPEDPALLVLDFLKESGGSESLLVDGSSTAVDFTFDADATDDILINEIRFVFGADDIHFDGASWGAKAILTNGLLVQIRTGGVDEDIIDVHQNEDFLRFASSAGLNAMVNNTGPKDFLTAALMLGGNITLVAGTSDRVLVRVRDDMTDVKHKYLTANFYGSKVA